MFILQLSQRLIAFSNKSRSYDNLNPSLGFGKLFTLSIFYQVWRWLCVASKKLTAMRCIQARKYYTMYSWHNFSDGQQRAMLLRVNFPALSVFKRGTAKQQVYPNRHSLTCTRKYLNNENNLLIKRNQCSNSMLGPIPKKIRKIKPNPNERIGEKRETERQKATPDKRMQWHINRNEINKTAQKLIS